MTELRFIGELTRAHSGDAGFDLRSTDTDARMYGGINYWRAFSTGVSVAIPDGHVGLVCPRSGLAAKHGVTVVNAPGVIDPGYRGEVKVLLMNLGERHYWVKTGDRIAQLVVVPLFSGEAVQVDSLDETDRGVGGFGSTGR